MEPHSIPQNVTSFEFHLVGDMTLKQFGYLATGLGFAYLIFIVLSTKSPLIAWPLILISSVLGVAFAFLPIEDRPLDWWLAAFLKAIFNPTQLKFKSQKISPETEGFKNRLNGYLKMLTPPPEEQPQDLILNQPLPQSLPDPKKLQETVELAKADYDVQKQISEAEGELAKIKSQADVYKNDPEILTSALQRIIDNITRLNKKASGVSGKLTDTAKKPITAAQEPKVITKKVTPLSLTSIPNIINGVVFDWAGNYIEGAIIVAHDKDGLPVRALKTNKLGQFIAATPLAPGVYILSIEKDSLVFDNIPVELKDSILSPITIQAKKEVLV